MKNNEQNRVNQNQKSENQVSLFNFLNKIFRTKTIELERDGTPYARGRGVKMPTIFFFTFLFLLFFQNKIAAQIFPPDFLCVRSDTLFWDIPTNPCGTFNNYEIYFSSNPTGPFSLLTTITNQGQNIYHHSNPAGDIWYYYLQSDFNCAGQAVLQSDTLNNRQPEIAILQTASINGNAIEINWLPSPSPETYGYIIFRNTALGTVSLDTIYGATSYIDNNAFPNDQSETYFVVALDECGNTSIFNDSHSTIFLTQMVAICDQAINLNWNLYDGWVSGIEKQEIWLSIDGGAPTLAAALSGTTTSYVFENALDIENYCFFIRATEMGSNLMVNSNEVCVTPDVVQKMKNLVLKNVNVLLDGSVELTWNWNSDAEIQSVEILQNNTNNAFTILNSFAAPTSLGNSDNFIDAISDPTTGKIFYKIQTTDDCDTLAFSNYGSTIHLTGTAQDDLTNFINWTAFDIKNATVEDYSIYRMVGGSVSFLETVSAGTTTYVDAVNPEKEEESNVCYFVIANAIVTLPDGSTESIESSSNIDCVEQLSNIIAPNAFAPQGRNQIFKPFIVFGETVNYRFMVYNRWGELLFETKNKSEGWNGKYKGKIQPMGAYVFHVKITQMNGRVIEEQGVFTLLR